MLYMNYKKELVQTAQALTERGYLTSTGGNLSMRIQGEQAMAITPSDFDYMLMKAEDVCVLSLAGERNNSPTESETNGAVH